MTAELVAPNVPSGRPGASGPWWCLPAAVLAGLVGLALLVDSARSTSATYDEVTYMEVACRWWRTGGQDRITRMGSPLTFWKLQQAPVLWWLDHTGRRDLVDDPVSRQSELLPRVRVGALWVWVVALGLTAGWARQAYGPRAMALAAWLFALGPNLLAHGALVTMEMPLVAASAGVFVAFWRFLATGRTRHLVLAGALAGLAFSCKFTAVLLPPLLAAAWWAEGLVRGRWRPPYGLVEVARGMVVFVAVMAAADLAVTGSAMLPLSPRVGEAHPSLEGRLGGSPVLNRWMTRLAETPLPQDAVGFLTQSRHQRSGGSSYLLGVRRTYGWWYYYLVALAVKVPPALGLLVLARVAAGRRQPPDACGVMAPVVIAGFLAVTAVGSSRNYGLRYLLPLAPPAVVWVSALAERARFRWLAWACLLGPVAAVASCHPDELTYFNALAGGRAGGRHVLADSNLDWGQGLRALARLQRRRPELRDLTLYYFGNTEPRHYNVAGTCHVIDAGDGHPGLPPTFGAGSPFVAVSASLQFGPWGPPGYFHALDGVRPVALTDDTTIAVYRTSDVPQ